MSDEKEKDKNGEKDTNASEAADLIKELGLLSTGSNFKSDIQYINIIGSMDATIADACVVRAVDVFTIEPPVTTVPCVWLISDSIR